MKNGKWVYRFEEGNAGMRSLLGGKGANLAEMCVLGLPVPPGFVITTRACHGYYDNNREISAEMRDQIWQNLKELEEKTGRVFGGSPPLLVSIRSGSALSMPGMMDTVLNLGMNRQTMEELARECGDRRFALDCQRRFIQMFANVVLHLDHEPFEEILNQAREKKGVDDDSALDEKDLEGLVEDFLNQVKQSSGHGFPEQPEDQLFPAIQAVFDSWHTPRAKVYRKANRISDDLGTAVNVQVMVFGNLGPSSATGVAFTRNPSTGEARLYGEYMTNAQGEDVVAGIRTAQPLDKLAKEMPEIHKRLAETCTLLEKHYREMQDIEFTVERQKLYVLQTRAGKRTAAASLKIAVEMVDEKLISREEALCRVDPARLEQLLHPSIDPKAPDKALATGLPASPGAVSGEVVFDANKAQDLAAEGKAVLLVRPETTPDDTHGIIAAKGILTARGGMTSHAAVVARGMGKTCVCGCGALKIDFANHRFFIADKDYPEGTVLTLDGSTGRVFLGEVPFIEPVVTGDFEKLLGWADDVRRLRVRANADTPGDAEKALELGAEGIGLCRTEHMFMSDERLPVMRGMILADSEEERQAALEQLLPMQREDFKGILRAMAGHPVTVRLLDPPLHEFLPPHEELALKIDRLRRKGGQTSRLPELENLLRAVNRLSESNPMLGHRGCRLGLVHPEIYRMQARALFEAAGALLAEGVPQEQIKVEVMIPLVGHSSELKKMSGEVQAAAEQVMREMNFTLEYLIGTMIELPRACVVADQLAQSARFFSFGTNDLTQTTLGYSRDDAEGKFLPFYLDEKILPANPFMELDEEGVGPLIHLAVEKGRKVCPQLKIGVCGEHGGDPASVDFFHRAGFDYVSCSPFRLPVARLAAARACLHKEEEDK